MYQFNHCNLLKACYVGSKTISHSVGARSRFGFPFLYVLLFYTEDYSDFCLLQKLIKKVETRTL